MRFIFRKVKSVNDLRAEYECEVEVTRSEIDNDDLSGSFLPGLCSNVFSAGEVVEWERTTETSESEVVEEKEEK